MYALYSLLTAVGMILLSPYFLVRGLVRGKYLDNIPERFGWRFPPGLRCREKQATSIWIHAVSVGEMLAALPLAQQLKQRYPHLRLVVSTTTATGQKLARERMSFADAIFYFPLDWKGPVRRALDAAQAAIVIVMETEIWPNFLRECRCANVPVIFVNGRLSEKSFQGFRRALSCSGGLLRGFLKGILSDASLFLMQSQQDADRLVALGAPAERVLVTGNLKYDLALPEETPLAVWLSEEFARIHRGPVLLAGSVVASEEAAVLRAFSDVEREFPRALLILAPRKPEQFNAAVEIISRSGHKVVRRGDITLNGAGENFLAEDVSVFLLDTLGELAALYRLADAVFVGGSLVHGGGHNILEPAAFGKVPVFGKSMNNFREMATTFINAGAGIEVSNAEELGSTWRALLGDPERSARMGASATTLVEQNCGATRRVLDHIAPLIEVSRGRQ